jgi:hypothetical protein
MIAAAIANGLVREHKISMIHNMSLRIGRKNVYSDNTGANCPNISQITARISFMKSALILAFNLLNGNCIFRRLNKAVRSGSLIGGRLIDNGGKCGTGMPGISGRLKLDGDNGVQGIIGFP